MKKAILGLITAAVFLHFFPIETTPWWLWLPLVWIFNPFKQVEAMIDTALKPSDSVPAADVTAHQSDKTQQLSTK